MKKFLIILLFFGIISGSLLILMKQRLQASMDILEKYHQQLSEKYGTDKNFDDTLQIQEALDQLENYIVTHQKNLMIKSWERETDLIYVQFYGGFSLILKFQPTGTD